MQRPLYMTAKDAISYGIIDRVVERDSKAIADVMSADAWDSAAGLVQKSM
jgi:ATP-dependent protease ClpP protease subunit